MTWLRKYAQDDAYMQAVEAGDMGSAQHMVEEAAKAAGYAIGPVWHGTDKESFNVFRPGWRESAIFFSASKDNAWKYARGIGDVLPGARVMPFYIRLQNPRASKSGVYPLTEARVADLKAHGYDGVVDDGLGEIIAFSPSQVKSADPVTRDDSGQVIPLSKRFDFSNPDIRH